MGPWSGGLEEEEQSPCRAGRGGLRSASGPDLVRGSCAPVRLQVAARSLTHRWGSNEHMGITINKGEQTVKQKTEWVGRLQGTAESETRVVCSRAAGLGLLSPVRLWRGKEAAGRPGQVRRLDGNHTRGLVTGRKNCCPAG